MTEMNSSMPLTSFTEVYRTVAFGGWSIFRQVLRVKIQDSTCQDWWFRSASSLDSAYETVKHANQVIQLIPLEVKEGWDKGAFFQSSEMDIQIFGRKRTWFGGPGFLIQFKTAFEQTELQIPEATSFKDQRLIDESDRIGLVGSGIVIYRNLPTEVAICLELFRHFHYEGP